MAGAVEIGDDWIAWKRKFGSENERIRVSNVTASIHEPTRRFRFLLATQALSFG